MSNARDAALESAVAEAARLFDKGDFAAARTALEDLAGSDPTGRAQALVALACYHLGDYHEAATHFDAALAIRPDEADWRDLRERAAANAEAEINVFVPPVTYFDREQLLAPLPQQAGLPPPPPIMVIGVGRKVRAEVGTVLAFGASAFVDFSTWIAGGVVGYKDAVWTNWYRKQLILGVLTLGHMRNSLNRHNLRNTYPRDALTGFVKRGAEPPPGVTHYRTADGTWNNLEDPKEGAAGTRFPRNVRGGAIRPETGRTLLTPNPREVSRKLLSREGDMKEVPFLNMLAASWINFQNHDWISHGQNLLADVHEIPLADDDPARQRFHQKNLFVAKTQPDPTRRTWGEPAPITFINEVTHWWDGSQIYGSDKEAVDRLRSHIEGKLRLQADGTLPLNHAGIEETGFTRFSCANTTQSATDCDSLTRNGTMNASSRWRAWSTRQ
jgi:hypothetical protein